MAEERGRNKIMVSDIYRASFLKHNGIYPELTLQGTQVIFEFDPSVTLYRLLRDYRDNPSIPVLDYANIIRRLRSKMFSMRGIV